MEASLVRSDKTVAKKRARGTL
ncbi:unnamed protein product [Callosobruchus maculatus]|uniref:Uncharacterized protein n=1 Tax=Callosobruchus maculatus TaxID=64391 RepID=A0A653DM81_CALMS|nr:unnamed protein product [Callosobruchus maculatus]